MTDEQLKEAVAQARSYCAAWEDAYNEGIREYGNVSLREVLYTLGYNGDEADEVVNYCVGKGFTYCIDPMIPVVTVGLDRPEYPKEWACMWGMDQLRSRLDCVR